MVAHRSLSEGKSAQLIEVLLEYTRALERGQQPDQAAFLTRHPELADELREYFQGQQVLADLAPPADAETTPMATGQTAADQRLPLPRSWGGYEILDLIAHGGMGVVYRARQKSPNRIVALKMIRTGEHASPAEVQRFRNEVEAVAELDHPHIVPIYEAGAHEGQLYYSMKLIDGINLSQHLAEHHDKTGTGLLSRTAVDLLSPIAAAVHHAHQRGILHRDLKPANILLSVPGPWSKVQGRECDAAGPGTRDLGPWTLDQGPGTPYVTDFGLSKRLTAAASLTESGALVGTPGYMAPEQAGGKNGVTVAADVYGLGAILYALLTGKPPFVGESVLDTLEQVRQREPEAPSRRNRAVDRDLETICLKCLRKDREQRYASAGALAEDLRRWRAGEPIAARPVGRLARTWSWCRRKPFAAALIATSVVAMLLTAAGLVYSTMVVSKANKDTTEALHRTEKERAAVATREHTARQQLYVAHINLAARAWETGNIVQMREFLRQEMPEPGQEDMRGFEWRYLWRLGQGQTKARVLRDHKGEVYTVAYSPDGKTLASGGEDGIVRLWDPDTGHVRKKWPGHVKDINSVAFSIDGKLLASGGDDGTVRLWDAATGQMVKEVIHRTTWADHVAFSPNGKLLAAGFRDGTIRIWELPSYRQWRYFTTDGTPNHGVCFTGDSKQLLDAGQLSLRLWDLALSQGRAIASDTWSAAVSPRGTLFACGQGNGDVLVWQYANGRQVPMHQGHTGTILSLAFSPDGETLATASRDSMVELRDVHTGALRDAIIGDGRRFWGIAFAPNGQMLASAGADGTVRLWEVNGRRDGGSVNAPSAFYPRLFAGDENNAGGLAAMFFDSGGVKVRMATLQGTQASGWCALPVYNAAGGAAVTDNVGSPFALFAYDRTGSHRVTRLRIPIPGRRFHSGASLPGGKTLIARDEENPAAGKGPRNCLRIWSLTAGECLRTLDQPGEPNTFLGLSADGTLLAGTSPSAKYEVGIWDTAAWRRLALLPQNPDWGDPGSAAFSRDKSMLASSFSRFACIYDIAARRTLHILVGHRDGISILAFSPDGKTLATGGGQGTVKLWCVATGQELLTLPHAPAGGLRQICFSADQSVLAAGTDNGVSWWLGADKGQVVPRGP